MPALFDEQALDFDQRAGLPGGAAQAIARGLFAAADLKPGQVLLEIGAGTGAVGACLADFPVRYLALDVSLPMLRVYAKRIAGAARRPALIQADGSAAWPIGDGQVEAVFSSRAMHLLDAGHVVRELFRVGSRQGLVVLTGCVRRDEDCPKGRMRRKMRVFMQEAGHSGRGGETSGKKVLDGLEERGGERLPATTVFRWKMAYAPRMSLDSWRAKPGLNGLMLPEAAKEGILQRLSAWAVGEFGSLDRAGEMEEIYQLNGVRLSKLSPF